MCIRDRGNAVLEYFTNKNVPCDMINAFSFVSDMTAKVLSHGHVFVYRNMPRLFGAGYRLEMCIRDRRCATCMRTGYRRALTL